MYTHNEKVEKVNVAEEMSKSFLDYSMSVIISRALPDARDGLKPSQRRILVRHERARRVCRIASTSSARRSSATRWATTIRTATRRSTRRSSTWRSRGRCARCSSMGRATSARSKAIRRRRCGTPRRAAPRLAALMDDMDKETVDFVPNYDERLDRAGRLPGGVSQPARQWRHRHRGRHGDEHPAAQSQRVHRRHLRADR